MSWIKSKPLQNSPEKTGVINNVVQMYDYAVQRGYDVYWYSFGPDGLESVSVMETTDGKCYIGLDPFKFESEADELCKGLHELGHCDTGSFYNEYAARDLRQKHENRADKRAIQLRISKTALDKAVSNGYTEIWQLAEHFGVTEPFMKKAVCWYTHGNLATDLYFN